MVGAKTSTAAATPSVGGWCWDGGGPSSHRCCREGGLPALHLHPGGAAAACSSLPWSSAFRRRAPRRGAEEEGLANTKEGRRAGGREGVGVRLASHILASPPPP
jgi:hypothetical protein